jgi:penicillin-binding protein 1B
LNSASYRIYTSLDTDLERYAGQAIEAGIKNLDAQLSRRYAAWLKQGEQVLPVQVGLVALDPHTGEIRALIGGRDYASSQLNHTLASRQPGSSFKPFVYAAAFDNAVEGLEPVLTPASTVVDEPTVFYFDGKEYSPKNDSDEYLGTVSLRDALVHSLNVATVKVAQEVGFRRVADLAKALGIGDVQATPSMALGAYETTPFEIAAAYTALANDGVRCEPSFLQRVVGPGGDRLEQQVVRSQRVLDSRVSYLVTNVLEDVVARGTGAGVRARGFIAPAAGKTGTSRDGWFAGYTSNLLCVVWVGFDDNRELGLTGAASAVPIWTEFMKRAVTLPRYRSTQPFVRPEGIVFMSIDPQTQQAATPNCPVSREEVFIAGTEPTDACALHGGLRQESLPPFSWFSRFFMQPIEDPKDQAGPQPKRAAKQNDKRNSFMRPVHSDRR